MTIININIIYINPYNILVNWVFSSFT